ncbi:MAG: ABC transporter substrate-binding protein, partial [Nitrospinae bacterium]|nr:ABC transporter substrate-binding protein [Nitrospinota bacterium]
GQAVTAEDVKFSFERYQGASASLLREKVQAVEIVDAQRIRLRLKEPWPDFMAFYGTPATGAAWVVPKAYVEKVGPDGFKKHPVGAGPYKFVRQDPGIAMVVEAYEGYWRMTPAVKRIIFKSVPEDATRLAMLKTGEADIAHNLLGPAAEEVRRDPRLRLVPVSTAANQWVDFFSQWDPKSPWHDVRVRLAANHAIDRRAIVEAESLGHSRATGSIVPREFEFALPIEPYAYDPERAKQLLREAGYPNGFDAGEIATGTGFGGPTEATAGYLRAVGIRVRVRSLERAAFLAARREKTLKDLAFGGTGALGNAATRLENFVIGGGGFAYGSYPDLDELFRKAARELDRTKREQMLHEIQRQVHERAIFAPIWQLTVLNGVGPRLVKPPFGDIPLFPYPSPYEEIQLKGGQ